MPLTIAGIFCISIPCLAQEYNFRHLTTEDGLPSNYTLGVLKDSHGFVWIATRAGICRYDGYAMKVFQYDPNDSTTLSDNQVTRSHSMVEDTAGDLWIATAKGLNKFIYHTETFERYRHDPNDSGSLSSDKIYCLHIDRSGTLWVGTGNRGGLNRYNSATDNFTAFQCEPDSSGKQISTVMAICEDRTGKFWIAAPDDLFQFDRDKGTFTRISSRLWSPGQKNRVFFRMIYEDPSGKLFFGTNKGYLIYDPDSDQLVPFEPFYDKRAFFTEMDILADPSQSDRTLWIAGWNLYHYDRPTSVLSELMPDPSNPQSIKGNMISSIYGDESGILWIASEFGVNILDPMLNQIQQHREFATKYKDAMSFLNDSQGQLWIGTISTLVQFDKEMKVVRHYNSLPVKKNETFFGNIWCIHEDSDKNLWVGTEENGLFVRESGKSEFAQCTFRGTIPESIPVFIWKITEDSNGNLWICALNNALFRKNIHEKPLSVITRDYELDKAFQNAQCQSVYEDSYDNLWIVTIGNGVFMQSPELWGSYEFIHYTHHPDKNKSLSSDRVWCVGEDFFKNVWIGTADGLNLYIPDSNCFQRFKSEQDKGANVVNNFAADESGNLWLTTESGLIRFDPGLSAGSIGSDSRMYYKKVLPFNDINPYVIYKSPDGRIFLGGSYKSGKGYYVFHPDSLRENHRIPPISLVDIRIRGEKMVLDTSIILKKHLVLRHNQNFFSFDYAALNYTYPELNQYSYMLEGLDEDWNFAGNRRYASYTGVPPGNYVFRVKGSNNDGYWNEQGASIAITIRKPPWSSWWATLLYVLFAAGIVISITWYYLKRQQLRHALALEHVRKEKLEELDHLKSRFFANISHEFRTPLTLILGLIDKIGTSTNNRVIKSDLSIIQRNADRLQRLIDQLLSLSKIEAGQMKIKAREENIVPFIRGYLQFFESAARQKGLELSFYSNPAEILLYFDRDKMEKILYNLLSNALKFTPEGGRVAVTVGQLANLPAKCVKISVTDTGPGISQEHLPHIFDRFYQADNSDTRFQQGSGIGLALTRELVELHHGKIEVMSETGTGTTFSVYLPMGKDHLELHEVITPSEEETAESIEPKAVSTGDEYSWQGIHEKAAGFLEARMKPILLIVEDNRDMRYYLRSILERPYRLFEAENGKDGIAIAIEKIPDVIVSDVMMPEMDGYEFSRKLKNDERTSHIPIILLTAKAAMEDKLEGLETGADDFITKPFQPQELLIRVKNLVAQRQQLREKFRREFEHLSLTPEKSMSSMDARFMEKVRKVLQDNFSSPEFDVDEFSRQMNLSRSQLHRKLHALFNLSATAFIRTYRLNAAARLIQESAGNVAEVAYEVGFNNLSYFSMCFRKQFGVNPSEFTRSKNGKR